MLDPGNTSAYAEKTGAIWRFGSLSKKHLRLRGENRARTQPPEPRQRTPPLARRKPDKLEQQGYTEGNTSAYAEKTLASRSAMMAFWKHLRLRGENGWTLGYNATYGETPPLTRRKPNQIQKQGHSRRNTSAYAEKTQSQDY